jgi:tetratricopeptide (TPR) repeat protein
MNIHKARLAGVVALVSFATQLAAPPCFAQTPEPTPQPPTLTESQLQQVERLTNQAFELHKQGKYAESIALYVKAYEINKASDILFNVATVYDRKLHERELAAEYYRRYIRTPDPNPELVKRATERLTGLKKEAEEEAAKRAALPPAAGGGQGAQAAPSGPTPEEREDRLSASKTWHTIGIVTGAVGLLGVAGGVLGAGGAANYYNGKANQDCTGSVCRSQQGVDDASKAGTWATISTVATAAGAGVLAIGVAMYFAAPKPFPAAGQITIAPQIGSSGGGMSVAGTF